MEGEIEIGVRLEPITPDEMDALLRLAGPDDANPKDDIAVLASVTLRLAQQSNVVSDLLGKLASAGAYRAAPLGEDEG